MAAVFEYKAFDHAGKVVSGKIDAETRQDVFKQLDDRGLRALKVQTLEGAGPKGKLLAGISLQRNGVSQRALEDFTHLLANLLAAGVPLSRALQILCRESSSPAAEKEWKMLHSYVIDGYALADAMAQFPKTFNSIYIAMVRAGEAGGFLDVVLEQIAEFQGREKDLRSRMMAALIYPAVLLMLAIGVLIFLLVFFIPRFKTIFEGFDAALPLLTRVIVQASEWMQHYGLLIGAGLVVLAVVVRQWLQSDQGRRVRDQQILRLPVIGRLYGRFAIARFARMFGTLLGAGVSLVAALRIARESLGNQTLSDALTDAVNRVQQGERLTDSLRHCPSLFPSSILEMVSVAEETGRLEKEFVRIAVSTEKELDRQLRTAVSLAEPLLLFLIAAFIGVIFIGMVMPIFSLQDYIN